MISDVEGPFRNRLNDLEHDNESLRVDNSKLKHDFSFLKTEYEHTLQRHKNILEDLRLQHEAEVSLIVSLCPRGLGVYVGCTNDPTLQQAGQRK